MDEVSDPELTVEREDCPDAGDGTVWLPHCFLFSDFTTEKLMKGACLPIPSLAGLRACSCCQHSS